MDLIAVAMHQATIQVSLAMSWHQVSLVAVVGLAVPNGLAAVGLAVSNGLAAVSSLATSNSLVAVDPLAISNSLHQVSPAMAMQQAAIQASLAMARHMSLAASNGLAMRTVYISLDAFTSVFTFVC